jgi:ABC-type Zn uptake system ZnuABC Zn-binding protein ZnuA
MRLIPRVCLLLSLLLTTVSCATVERHIGSREGRADSPLAALTSITVLADLIQQVGGKRVEVRALVPSGADPNTFQPAPREVLAVGHARIVFLNGLGLDRTVRGVVAMANRPDLQLVTLSDGLPTLDSGLSGVDRRQGTPDAPGRGNPYLWLDPHHAVTYVERIRESLTAIDPSGAASYASNAEAYTQQLVSLERELDAQLAVIPRASRKLVTLHDGFPYFAARFGLQLVAVAIKTPGREPSAQEVANLARAMRVQQVPTVFTEPQLDARLLKLAARDAGLRIGTLYSDTLDAHVPTYQALLRYNARQLLSGLM